MQKFIAKPRSPAKQGVPGLNKHRIEGLGDGIYSIAMTLLILDIKIPALAPPLTEAKVWQALAALWPSCITYVLSFAILGIYWVAHHNHLQLIKRTDRLFTWLHIFTFAVICVIPFSTGLLGAYHSFMAANLVYGLNLLAVFGMLYLQFRYATKDFRLTDPIPPAMLKFWSRSILFGAGSCALAICLAFINTSLSAVIYLTWPLAYIIPGALELLNGWLGNPPEEPQDVRTAVQP